jgi:hypothetical protein
MDEHEGGDDGGSHRQLTHQDPVHLTQEITGKTQPLADPDKIGPGNTFSQYCGSGSEGFFWPSGSGPFYHSSKDSKKNHNSVCLVTSLTFYF